MSNPMEYHFYQTFENGELYDRFITAVKQAEIPHQLKLLEAGNNNSIGLPEAMQLSPVAGFVVFSAHLTTFPRLNAILEPLVREYYPESGGQLTDLPADEWKRKLRQVYGVNKIEFYTIRHALTQNNMLPGQLEEAAIVDTYESANLQKKMSLTPVWVLGGLAVLFALTGLVPGPLLCILLAVYAANRKNKKQEMPDGSFINLYDDASVRKAAILLPVAIILLLISIGLMIAKFA